MNIIRLSLKFSRFAVIFLALSLALVAMFAACDNGTAGGNDIETPHNPFQGVWSGYYTNGAIVRMDFTGSSWMLTFEHYSLLHVRQGNYIYSGDRAALGSLNGTFLGSTSVSGKNMTVELFTGEVWDVFTITSENSVGTVRGSIRNRRLNTIALVEQPWSSNLCAVANIKMIENHYFNASNSWEHIFEKVSRLSVQGNENSATYRVGFYLEKRDLYSSVVQFSDLSKILDYCEVNQIPAIMIIQAVDNPLLGHSVLFAGYNSATGYVAIRDPDNSDRTRIHYDDLRNSFKRVASSSEILDNTIVIASDRIISEKSFFCGNCGKRNIVDAAILDAVTNLLCKNCGYRITVW